MAALPGRKLHLVGDQLVDEHGEIIPVGRLREEVLKLQADLKAAEKDLRAKRRQISELQRDKARERLDYERYKDVERIAVYWWRKCRAANPRVHYMAPNRFDAVRGLLDLEDLVVEEVDGKRPKRRREPHYSMDDFRAAIDGAAYDPFVVTYKNGRQEPQNDLEQICRDSTRFDRFIAKAPLSRA